MALCSSCPVDPEETDEALVLNRLSAEETADFQGHLGLRPRCATIASNTRAFVQALRDAEQRSETHLPANVPERPPKGDDQRPKDIGL